MLDLEFMFVVQDQGCYQIIYNNGEYTPYEISTGNHVEEFTSNSIQEVFDKFKEKYQNDLKVYHRRK